MTKKRRATRPESSAATKKSAEPISRAWRVWVAQNLLRGVERAQIEARLAAEGLSATAAASAIDEVLRSAVYEAALPLARDARRSAMIAKLRRAVGAASPQGVARVATPDANTLRAVFAAHATPVVFTDLVTRWPAFQKWTPSWLREHYGEESVDVMCGRDADPDYDPHAAELTRAMPLRQLIDALEAGPSNDLYLVARGRALEKTRLRELWADVAMPEGYLSDPSARGGQLWIGPAGTLTPLHHDTSSIIFCQVYGRKRWLLIAPEEATLLDGARSLYAGLDPERDDMGRARVREVVLEAGEALYVPVGYWHHVRALDPSISVAINALPFDNHFDWYRPGQIR